MNNKIRIVNLSSSEITIFRTYILALRGILLVMLYCINKETSEKFRLIVEENGKNPELTIYSYHNGIVYVSHDENKKNELKWTVSFLNLKIAGEEYDCHEVKDNGEDLMEIFGEHTHKLIIDKDTGNFRTICYHRYCLHVRDHEGLNVGQRITRTASNNTWMHYLMLM